MTKKLTTNLTLNMIKKIRDDIDLCFAIDEWVSFVLSHPNESWTLRDWLKAKETEIKTICKDQSLAKMKQQLNKK